MGRRCTKALSAVSIASYDLIPMATSALMQCTENFDRLQYNWLSLLASPGFLLYHSEMGRHEDNLLYVMGTTEHGILCLHVKSVWLENRRFLNLVWGDLKPKCKHQCITSLGGWRVLTTAAVPPAKYVGRQSYRVRVEVTSSKCASLLESAALEVASCVQHPRGVLKKPPHRNTCL